MRIIPVLRVFVWTLHRIDGLPVSLCMSRLKFISPLPWKVCHHSQTAFAKCTPDHYNQDGETCINEWRSLGLPCQAWNLLASAYFRSQCSQTLDWLIDSVNIFWDRFNKQTVTYLVRVDTDLVHLLVSCFVHSCEVVCFLAFKPRFPYGWARILCMSPSALSRVRSLLSLINRFSQILREFVPKTILSRIISSGSLKEHSLTRSFRSVTNCLPVSDFAFTLLWNL